MDLPDKMMYVVSDETPRKPDDEIRVQYPNLLRHKRDAIKARGNWLSSGTETGLSSIPPPNSSSAPMSTPIVGIMTDPYYIDLGASEPTPFRIHCDPRFQRTQVNANVTHPIVDVLGGGSVLGSGFFTFTPPPLT